MAYDTTPPDRIPESVSGKKAVEPEKPVSQPPSTFESYMQGAPGQPKTPAAPAAPPTGISPMELTRPTTMQTAGVSFDSLLAQAKVAQDGLGTVGQQLNTPNLKLKRSQTHLVKNKLQDANGYLRAAGAKLGVENPPLQMPAGANAIGRFLTYIGDGQDQLNSVSAKLKEMSATPDQIRPGDMMYMQIKMSQAQQEIDYSTILLGKVIDSIRQILNIQL